MHLILHIPHASTAIPDRSGYVVDDATLEHELLQLTDWHTDHLYTNERDTAVVAPFSRLFCDAERFPDDAREVMARAITSSSPSPAWYATSCSTPAPATSSSTVSSPPNCAERAC